MIDDEIDITNKYGVCAMGSGIGVLTPVRTMTREDTLTFAAWLVALADTSHDNHRFSEILTAVQNS